MLATSSHAYNPRFLSRMASYDVVSTILRRGQHYLSVPRWIVLATSSNAFKPSFLELYGILCRGEHYLPGPLPAASSKAIRTLISRVKLVSYNVTIAIHQILLTGGGGGPAETAGGGRRVAAARRQPPDWRVMRYGLADLWHLTSL